MLTYYFKDAVTNLKEDDIIRALRLINTLQLYQYFESTVIIRIETHVRNVIVPQFWKYFNKPESEYEGFKSFQNSINMLHENYLKLCEYCNRLDLYRKMYDYTAKIYNENNARDAFKLILRATILSQLPTEYKTTIEYFYKIVLCLDDSVDNLSDQCAYCSNNQTECLCVMQFHDVNK